MQIKREYDIVNRTSSSSFKNKNRDFITAQSLMKDSLDSYQTKTNFGYFMGISKRQKNIKNKLLHTDYSLYANPKTFKPSRKLTFNKGVLNNSRKKNKIYLQLNLNNIENKNNNYYTIQTKHSNYAKSDFLLDCDVDELIKEKESQIIILQKEIEDLKLSKYQSKVIPSPKMKLVLPQAERTPQRLNSKCFSFSGDIETPLPLSTKNSNNVKIKLSKPIINTSNNLSYLYNNDNIYQTIDDNLIEENSMDELSNACQQLKDRAKTILDKYNSELDKFKKV